MKTLTAALALFAALALPLEARNAFDVSGRAFDCQKDEFTISFRPTGTREPVSLLRVTDDNGKTRATVWLVGSGYFQLCDDVNANPSNWTSAEGWIDGYNGRGNVESAPIVDSVSFTIL